MLKIINNIVIILA